VTAVAGDLDPADGLLVRGGAGGTTALLDDLEHGANRLQAAGHSLAEVAAVVAATATDPVLLASYALAPLTGIPAESSVAAATVGPSGVVTSAAAVAALGGTLRAAVRLYRAADAVAAHAVQALAFGVGLTAPVGLTLLAAALPSSSPAAALAATAALAALADDDLALLELLAGVPGVGDLLGAALPGALAGVLTGIGGIAGPVGMLLAAAAAPRDQRRLARMLSAGAAVTPFLRESGRVRATIGPARPGVPPRGVRTLIDRTDRLYPSRGGTAGAIRVERITGRDGSRSWIVLVPGTEDWAPRAGGNPFDLSADVAAVGGRSTAAGALVVRAVRGCGARPGEPVLLVGHSLGGIVAAELAADPEVRRELRITHVVVAGAPIADSRIPDDVQVLALEHDLDPVTWVDGAPNPDRSTWVTAHAPGPGGIVDAHEAGSYARTASAVDGSHDPGLVRARAALAPFLDRPGARATVWQVEGARVPAAPAAATADPVPARPD